MIVLGISAEHNSSACLMKNGVDPRPYSRRKTD